MQCVIHESEEAVDACRSCGKPLCAGCGVESGGAFVCSRCRAARAGLAPPSEPGSPSVPPAGTDPSAGAMAQAKAPHRRRSPALAALLSFVPGGGQLYNGEALKALAFLSIFSLLVLAAVRLAPIGVFAAFFWFYQVFEAFHTALLAGRTAAADASREGSAWTAWGLVGLGLVAFAQNLTGAVLPHLRWALPVLAIFAGLRLLVSYFRTAEDARP